MILGTQEFGLFWLPVKLFFWGPHVPTLESWPNDRSGNIWMFHSTLLVSCSESSSSPFSCIYDLDVFDDSQCISGKTMSKDDWCDQNAALKPFKEFTWGICVGRCGCWLQGADCMDRWVVKHWHIIYLKMFFPTLVIYLGYYIQNYLNKNQLKSPDCCQWTWGFDHCIFEKNNPLKTINFVAWVICADCHKHNGLHLQQVLQFHGSQDVQINNSHI